MLRITSVDTERAYVLAGVIIIRLKGMIYMYKLDADGKLKDVDVTIDDLCNQIIYLSKRIDNIELSSDEVMKMLRRCRKESKKRPDTWRDVRHELLTNRDLGKAIQIGGEDHILCEIVNKYGYRSIVSNTMARMVSLVKLTKQQIAKQMKGKVLPAFDKTLPFSESIPDGLNAYEILREHWRYIPNLKKLITSLRDRRKLYLNRNKLFKEPTLLTNGSSQGFVYSSINITDFMANLYAFPELRDPEYNLKLDCTNLCNLLGVDNNRDDETDPYVYLYISDQYEDYAFNIVALADKDGKIRVIYQGRADIQAISKAFHEFLDGAVRELEGNYTYNQRDWIKTILLNRWYEYKYIIGIDISKFSDTLHRTFMLEILRMAGFGEDELYELDKLYSLPVKDLDDNILFGTLATYQGQYGDFPWITLSNLAIQYMVYYKLDATWHKGYNAAVGDDTGFIFDQYIPEAFSVIKYLYGSAGMNINRNKTGELIPGIGGVVDFVKLRFDEHGIVPFIEPKPYYVKDFDQSVRDIFDSDLFFDYDTRKQMLINYVGDEAADILLDISIINGGINMRVIEARDVNELIYNRLQLTHEGTLKFGNFYTWLNRMSEELYESGYTWCDTVFSQLPKSKRLRDELEFKLETDEIEEGILLKQLNDNILLEMSEISELGGRYSIEDYRRLLGQDPTLIYENHKEKMRKHSYDKDVEELYDIIKENDSWMGRLKKKKISRTKVRNIYKSKILDHEATVTGEYIGLNVDSEYESMVIYPDDLDDYMESAQRIIRMSNNRKLFYILCSKGIIHYHNNQWGERYFFTYGGKTRRLIRWETTSKYAILSKSFLQQVDFLRWLDVDAFLDDVEEIVK